MLESIHEGIDLKQLLVALVALRKGDFSVRMPLEYTGLAGKIADTLNDIIELNQNMNRELERVSLLVGKEGRVSQRASLSGATGGWATSIEAVNTLIVDLVTPTIEMARVVGAVAKGDLSQHMTTELEGRNLRGEFATTANTVNTMVDQLSSFASEVTRVAREVGTNGKLGGQAVVLGVGGTWKDLTESVNAMASNLTSQVRNIADVTTAVANGDLSKKITVDARGEILQLKDTINTMVDQLRNFSLEVTRVAREVGTDGKLGGQAVVLGVGGTWKDLTESVNAMASNLTSQVRNIADVTTAVARGDLSRKITVDARGEILELKNTINTMVDQLRTFSLEVTRVAKEVGTDGKLGGQAVVLGVGGTWKDLTDNVNLMAANLTGQVRNIADVTTAVARGDLSKKITVDVKGEILELKNTINQMVDQLNGFAEEVTRVAREVGTDGKLGGQAQVKGVSGTWKDLTDNVNLMAANLTGQVRNIADVTTAVANGDLSKKITVDVKGEILELKNTINQMVDQLSAFASEVTRVAKEVGTEGQLGGQAEVKGVSGIWKDLTDNVNLMAANLTGQVRNIAEVTTAVANGDLSKKITVDVNGEILELKDTLNQMVDQLRAFASEVTRVAKEVGTDGKLGGQAVVRGVGGTWKDLTDNVNLMAANLTGQVRNIAEVTTAVANGDLSKKITVDARGEISQLKDTINTMVDQLSAFASEVTRMAREVGTDGKLGGQAVVLGVGGTWKDLTESVNAMASNLTTQVRNIADVTTAVARGDLSRKITVDARGEILELKSTINTMVDQLSSFASEVTRVAKEVGTDGKLGGQAYVRGVGGTWKDLTDNVNLMAANLTGQVRNIAEVTTAVANGDLSKKITVDVKGEILELKNTINQMVDQLNGFAEEVTRVAREVGTDGKLGGQAQVKGVSGTWKVLTDNVNRMGANLTSQVRNIAEVTTAVANGDLSKKITVDVRGEVLELKRTINTMVDQLSAFASEVTRVAKEVGTDGKLGGQAQVKGVSGTWKDLTDNVNLMASNLTGQVRNIAEVTTAVANGDLSKKITVNVKGEILELKNTINTMVDQLSSFASEVTRVAKEVGTDGKLGGQAVVKGAGGTWKDLTDNVNLMAANLTGQVRNIADVTTAVARGDLSKKITVDVKGEILELKNTINQMVDQLNGFAEEVTRVAREVGTEGQLGGQAEVKGVSGTWKDLTDNVNRMASNLTSQVRNIADVTTAVARGELTKKITVEVKGEILQLKNTINQMVDQLSAFASEVTRVAREVGTDGKLGGQAQVKGVSGIWKDLTDNINQMIRNLQEITRRNTEQDWLKTNLAKLTRMLQGQRDLTAVARGILSEVASLVDAQHGAFYLATSENSESSTYRLLAGYALRERKNLSNQFRPGEGLIGQCALEKERILITNVPADYVQITSGLGEAKPLSLVVQPVIFEGQVKAIVELASFNRFTEIQLAFLEQISESIGVVLNTISTTTRTEDLLKQSLSLTQELQGQQQELQETNKRLESQTKILRDSEEQLKFQQQELQAMNEELAERAQATQQQKNALEQKNREIEEARRQLVDKAEQLALTSKYKSEFLANMSHELRTPLNSMLILSQMLSENMEQNLTEKQAEYARTIYASGSDLLMLINDILDLSKIEAGAVILDIAPLSLASTYEFVERSFRPVAEAKGLAFSLERDDNLPELVHTDERRLHQVLKNLLSNAFKFTERGSVSFRITRAAPLEPNDAKELIAFTVEDTGIGIPKENQKIIFEAFQQADSGTSRKYGGTGLGLSISRELARLLGGEIHLESTPGQGSTFTLYLPILEGAQHPRTEELSKLNGSSSPSSASHTFQESLTKPTINIPEPEESYVEDDREHITKGDRVLLIVEDDAPFGQILLDLARQQGFRGLVANNAKRALSLVRRFPVSAITLDLHLPDRDGWVVLDQLKHDPTLRHIPVYIISVAEPEVRSVRRGAVEHLQKPMTKEVLEQAFSRIQSFIARSVRRLLIVGGDNELRDNVTQLIGDRDVQTIAVNNTEDALSMLSRETLDCMVLDLRLPNLDGFGLLEKLTKKQERLRLPIIVYTEKELTQKEETKLKHYAESIVVKNVRSLERLIDEAALFLHRVLSNFPEATRKSLRDGKNAESVLVGKKVLIVDDDVRNIFALTSALERHGMQALHAENGKDGIELLQRSPDIDVVLMDIMMPEMDGYKTMSQIRQSEQFTKLPIIALTAKAMQDDREKCIKAGASDYLAKPVDLDQLLSLLRVWLYQ